MSTPARRPSPLLPPLSLDGQEQRDTNLTALIAQRPIVSQAIEPSRTDQRRIPQLLSAACLAAAFVHPAYAQDAQTPDDALDLPEVSVEAPVAKTPLKKKAKKAKKPAEVYTPVSAGTSSGAPAQAAPPAPPEPLPPTVEAGQKLPAPPSTNMAPLDIPVAATPGGNPYADPDAEYKINASANTKLTEPLLDTPRTVTTVPKEVLEDQKVTSLRDLARTTPGVTIGTGEGGNAFGDVLFIRGFKSSNDAYIDGIRDPGVVVRENFMIEQVEILKGPSSSISGRGTTGGAINVVTKKPQGEDFAEVSTTIGTDSTRRVTADINEAFNDTFAIRANGMWQESDVAGRDDVYDDRWGGAISAMWKPSDSFRLTADYYHLDISAMPDWGVPWDGTNGRPYTESGLPRDTFYGVLSRDFLDGNQDIATLTAEIAISDNAVLTSKLRYGETLNHYIVSIPRITDSMDPDAPNGEQVSVGAQSRKQSNQIVANQTDITTRFLTGGVHHTLVTGVEVSRESISRRNYQGLDLETFGADTTDGCFVSIFNPDTTSCGLAGTPTLQRQADVQVDTKSIYLLDTMRFGPQWMFTGGVRIDDYEIELDNYSSNTSLDRQDTMFNWNAALTYKPASNGSIYFAYGTSTNPVGEELDAGGSAYGGLTPGTAPFAPERNKAYELGTKWELFDRNLLVSAALFQTTKENAREATGRGANEVVTDSGEYRVRGIELSAAGKLTDALSIYGGLVLMDSEVLESRDPNNIGEKFANIAHTTFTMMAKYQLTDKLAVGGQATYQGEINAGSLAANGNVLPSYWRFDAMAEYQLTENIEIQVNGLNLTDETNYDALYRSGTPFVYIGPGRAGYVTINYKY